MPTLGVNALVFDGQQVLLIKRTDIPVWALPGGQVDAGESLEAAVIRETSEETGLTVRVHRLLGLYSRPLWRRGGDHLAVFWCFQESGGIERQSSESGDCAFFPVDALPEETWPPHVEMISDGVKNPAETVIRSSGDRWPFGDDAPWRQLVESYREAGLPLVQFFRAMGIQS